MWWSFFIAIALLLVFIVLLFSLTSLMIATFSGAPYVPTRSDRIKTIVKVIEPKPGMNIVDLGSGDGRVVRALAKSGAIVIGYEIQWLLVIWSRILSKIKHLPTAQFYRQNLFNVNLKNYDVIVMYALPNMMHQLRQKFEAELQPGAKVISVAFPIDGWEHTSVENGVYVYKIAKYKPSNRSAYKQSGMI